MLIMDLDLAMKTYQTVRDSEKLSEYQKKMAVRFAYDSGEEVLTSRLISEMIQGDKANEELRKEYGAFTDEMPKWAENFSELILTMGMYSIEQEETLKEVNERLEEMLWQTKSQKQSR